MRVTQSKMLSPRLSASCAALGALLARLRVARAIKQSDAALRAGISRNTAYRLERGDPGVALGQVLRYLDAIAPGCSLLELLSEKDPALISLRLSEKTHRVRDMTAAELLELDF